MQLSHPPKHVLIILDGHRRWAKVKDRPRSESYQIGAERFREVSRAAFKMGISYVTFWLASGKNLKEREPQEIMILILLLRQELENTDTLQNLIKNQTRFRVLGDWHEILHARHFSYLHDLQHLIQSIQVRTEKFDRHFLTLLFGYSGASELDEAERRMCEQPSRNIKPGILRRMLETRDLPPVDLIIRTGAEKPNQTHVSDGIFSPWLTPNSQLFSPQVLGPDFTAEMFQQAVRDYSEIPRRFGA